MHQQSVLQTMLSSAANKNDALIFNLASEALNTSYFLSKLVSFLSPLVTFLRLDTGLNLLVL